MDEKLRTIAGFIAIAASILFALIPFDRSRIRAAWAKGLFVAVGIVGVFVSVTQSVVYDHWVARTEGIARIIPLLREGLIGFALGLITALILSDQLRGSKRASQTTDGPAA